MYTSPHYHQISFFDFNQSCGMQLDDTNEWVHLADHLDWAKMEEAYSAQFPSSTGRPAKPFRMALGSQDAPVNTQMTRKTRQAMKRKILERRSWARPVRRPILNTHRISHF